MNSATQQPLFDKLVMFNYTLDKGRVNGPLGDAPVIVSNGVGVDSVALLVELHRARIVPDAIVTALVGQGEYGNEHRRFYEYIPVLERWLASVGFPPMTFVWYEMKKQAKHFEYRSLAGNCISNRTLPSLAFRRNHSCSLKWKGDEIDRWVTAQYGARPCYRLVGYDCNEGHRNDRFSTKQKKKGPRAGDLFIYPLQYLGLGRRACEESIVAAGLPLPGKSSCIFCPSMRPEEVDELSPEELWRIVIMEAHATINLKSIKGLWTNARMTDYIVIRGLLPADMVAEVWAEWSAEDRPPSLQDNPDVVADQVLFEESKRLADIVEGD